MADQQPYSPKDIKTRTFSKSMVKDLDESYSPDGTWFHAINGVNIAHDGDLGNLVNEPANRYASKVPYSLIGAIPLSGDKWVLFSTDDLDSEIGVFDDSEELYVKKVNDRGLGFNRKNLITGASKKNHDCTYSVYFADSNNPDRALNLDKIPYIEKVISGTGSCRIVEPTDKLDIESLRLSRLIETPSLKLRKSNAGGSLPNGSYQVVIAYTINSIRITDYFIPSNIQSLFDHRNLTGALEVDILEMDTDFDEFELVLISTINQQAGARKIGVYSTRQKTIFIDQIRENLPVIPLERIPIQTPAYEKSDAIYQVNDFLLRVGPYTKPEINYQIIANDIKAKWVAVEVPANYYAKGGNAVGNMRDEVYAYFIRWVYNTGEKTALYAIIGRRGTSRELAAISGGDVFELEMGLLEPSQTMKRWQVENTATITSGQPYDIPEGRVILEGEMGYYESTEKFPDNKPAVWGENCGKQLRFHKMPDNNLVPLTTQDGKKIVLLAVKFDNIKHPLDIDGNPVTSIVGYEILRASREGNRSIIAKGILNNAGEYNIPDSTGVVNPNKENILGKNSDNKSGKVGLYPNFPYNDLRPNSYLSKTEVKGGCQGKGYQPLDTFRKDVFTFHSPETQFRNPFLGATELKIHGEIYGQVKGEFAQVYKHPRNKLVRDFALIVSGIVGVGAGLLAISGKKTTTNTGPSSFNLGIVGVSSSVPGGGAAVQAYYAGKTLSQVLQAATGLDSTALGDLLRNVGTATDPKYLLSNIPGVASGNSSTTHENTAVSSLPLPIRLLAGAHLFSYYFAQGTEQALRIIKALVPYQQYAYQYNSHGFYNQYSEVGSGNRRRYIKDSVYLEPYLQEFAGKYRVNNLFRSRQVMLELHKDLAPNRIPDDSRTTIGELQQWENPQKGFTKTTSAYYASLKVPLHAQYGQLESCTVIPVSNAVHKTEAVKTLKFSSPVLFGGDVYINRYTEKNSICLFNEWMHDMQDGTEWNYRDYINVPFPRYWMDTTQYEFTNLTSSLIRLNFKDNVLPNDFAHLDRRLGDCKKKVSFIINNAYFYAFVNGVRDFFCESELNLAHRDFGDRDEEKHYDANSFSDLKTLFRSDIIKSGNHFKYDLSLSASRLLHNYISWGSMLPRDYDPEVYTSCYQHREKRIMYSLPQQEELKKDNWTVFLANNYKDFGSKVTAVHSVDKSGAIIFFEDRAPVQFVGVDQLQTDGGIKLTVGDGGLFQQPLSSISSADNHYEYGACQNRLSIINTPAGLFYMSQRQGKVFRFADGLAPISNDGMMTWFNEFLPSLLIKDFPAYDLADNPVIGVGCQAVYDSTIGLVYFTKKDYKLRDKYKGKVTYVGNNEFRINGRSVVKLENAEYFEDASWTISYDPKSQQFNWISFHDWHPDYILPSSVHFYTVKEGKIWKHNDRTDLFCNYYGNDYTFDVEFPIPTGQDVNTLSSAEYILECSRYSGRDKQHILDFNFDRAMIWNTEQHSGNLRLTIKPKNNPYLASQPPTISNDGTDTYFTKEENKYRINQFYDLTRNRGEFIDSDDTMWITEANGYRKQPNPKYFNFNKNAFQRKKFRHYNNFLLLRRSISRDIRMSLKMVNAKLIKSVR